MKKILILILLSLGFCFANAQQITRGEYFLETDPGEGLGTTINVGSPADSVNPTFSFSTIGLPVGFHKIYTRVIDSQGQWSYAIGHLFYIKDTTTVTFIPPYIAPALKKGESFIDTDPGVGLGTAFTFTQADSINNIPVAISTNGIAPGFHKLYIRVKNTANIWSLHEQRLFYVVDTNDTPPVPPVAAPIVAMEYFFDNNDVGPGQGAFLNPFTPGDSVTVMDYIVAQDPLFMTPLSVGTHTVNMRAKDAAGQWGMTKSVGFTVCSQPAVSGFSAVVTGASVTFTNTSTNDFGTKWIFGDGAISTSRNASHTYNNGGIMNVCLISYSGCGNDTSCQNVTLSCISPTASFTNTGTNLTVAFNNTSTGASSVLWNFGDGKTSTLMNPTHVFQNTGTYNVCLTTYNGCGSATICQNVSVTCVAPVSGFTYVVSGQTVSFTSTATNAYIFVWQFGNSTTNNSSLTPSVQYTNPGTYLVKLIVQNGCGTNTYQINVVVACSAPTAEFNVISSGLSAEVENVSVNGTTWLWNFGDATTSPFKNPAIHTFPSTGSYSVCLTATNGCGNQQICHTVDVCTGPTANFTGAPSGTTVNFTNTSSNGASSYWTFGNGYATNQVSPNYSYPASGTYNVCLNVSNSCGSDTLCKSVTTFCSTAMNQEICLVTVDVLSTHNIIVWEKPTVTGIDSFRVYREVTTNVYGYIASVAYDSLSEYHDYGANPNVTSYKYKLTVIDTCGNESVPADWSNFHSTIHLQNLGLGNLQWTLYDIENSGNPVTYYRVYRDDANTGNFLPISSTIPGGNSTYTDVNYASYANANYRVDVAWSISCTPTRATVNTTRSNIKHQSIITGINSQVGLEATVVYPNPANDHVNIEFMETIQKANIRIMNSIGQVVYEQKVVSSGNAKTIQQINTGNFAKGIYTIVIESNRNKAFKKLVIN